MVKPIDGIYTRKSQMFFDPVQESEYLRVMDLYYTKNLRPATVERDFGWWEDEVRGRDPLWRKACRSVAKLSFETLPDDTDLDLWTLKLKPFELHNNNKQVAATHDKIKFEDIVYRNGKAMYNSKKFTGSSGPR